MFRTFVFVLIVLICSPALARDFGVCRSAPATASSTDRVFIQRGTQTKRSELKHSMAADSGPVSWAAAAAEFVAMTLFVIMGCGSAMGVAKEPGWVLQVSISFGLAITSLAFAVGKYSGAQINCAVTFGLVLFGRLSIMQGLLNFAAQLLGSVAGAFILSKMHSAKSDKTGCIACNSINSDAGYSVIHALVGEIAMTALLMFTVLETTFGAAAAAPAAPFAAIAIGLAVFLAHSVLIPIDGCSINPTRSFGPAVVRCLTRENAAPSSAQRKAPQSNDALISAQLVRQDHGIDWVRRILENEKERHSLCETMFTETDQDASGTLDVDEVVTMVNNICSKMHINFPGVEKVKELSKACIKNYDANKDGVLSLKEFRTAFKATLKSCLQEAERELAEETGKEQQACKKIENSTRDDAQQVDPEGGKGNAVWKDMWVFWVGPLLGSAVAVSVHHNLMWQAALPV